MSGALTSIPNITAVDKTEETGFVWPRPAGPSVAAVASKLPDCRFGPFRKGDHVAKVLCEDVVSLL